MRFHLIHKHPARTVHGLYCIIHIVDYCGIHIFPVVFPMAGSLPQTPVKHHGRGDFHVALLLMNPPPVIHQNIFQYHSPGQEKGEPRPFLHNREQSQLFSYLPVIPGFCLLQHLQVFFQLGSLGKRNPVNPRKHFIVLISPPVGPGNGQKLKRLDLACIGDVRPCTEFRIIPLPVKADCLLLWKILNHFKLIGLPSLIHIGSRFLSAHLINLQWQRFLYDLSHLSFDCLELFL
ncbi:hypothetical protein IMSAGC009_03519 [Lachnospiraceae bacterium]|nr:hypothetical protein IMSAGC009_03519 [Lachnospiraceae bacterium]